MGLGSAEGAAGSGGGAGGAWTRNEYIEMKPWRSRPFLARSRITCYGIKTFRADLSASDGLNTHKQKQTHSSRYESMRSHALEVLQSGNAPQPFTRFTFSKSESGGLGENDLTICCVSAVSGAFREEKNFLENRRRRSITLPCRLFFFGEGDREKLNCSYQVGP